MIADSKHADGMYPGNDPDSGERAVSQAATSGAEMPPAQPVSGFRHCKPYPAYKDSGVAWLGEVPKHWEVRRLSVITQCLDGRRVPLNAQERGTKQGDYPYWGANSIVDYVDDWLFDEELVLIGEDGAPFFDSNRPVAFHVTGRIWVNNHIHVLRPNKKVVANFLTNVLNCVDYRTFIAGSTRDKLTQGDMNAISIQCPPLSEQTAIAAFLDRETAKIDALVAKKERLIQLLREKRTALTSHAVTRGLDPDAPLKDSGVEWLGEVPAHWEVKATKRVCHIVNGATPKSAESRYWSGDIPWITPEDFAHLDRGYILSSKRKITWAGYQNCGTTMVPIGSLVLSTRAPIGHLGIAGVKLCTNQGCRGLIFRHKDSEIYYFFQFSACRIDLQARGQGSTFMELSKDKLADFEIAVPPLPEQTAIAAFLDRETAKIDALVAKIEEAIDRLREYRAALISAAVTGKIDVRDAA